MNTVTQQPGLASSHRSARYRMAGYWLATIPVVAELGLGGIWDITRIPYVRDLVTHLGYPTYPGRPFTAAIVSHFFTGGGSPGAM